MGKKDKKQAPELGIVFPPDNKGGRSTSSAGKKILSAALQGCGSTEGKNAAVKVEQEKNWRFKYHKHVKKLVDLSLSSPNASLNIAKAGLDYIHSSFEFVPEVGKPAVAFRDVVTSDKFSKITFSTGLTKGTGSKDNLVYTVPYNGGYTPSNQKPPGPMHILKDQSLRNQIIDWTANGVIEPDAASAISKVSDYFKNGSNLNDCYFIVIGAGSAMGPFNKLLELGANVIAIDIPGQWFPNSKRPASGLWKRLIETAEKSPGTLYFPLSKDQNDCKTPLELYQSAGCDLMTQPREICNWLLSVLDQLPKEARLMIGNYTYLDGGKHVKLTLAADAIMQNLRQVYPKMGVAFLCTPTDIHVVSSAVNTASKKNSKCHGLGWFIEKIVQSLSCGKKLISNVLPPVQSSDGKTFHLVDGLTVAQGPNYAIAKRMQHWRAQITFEEGAIASSRIAPSTATTSVMHNKSFQWAYFGMPYFKPLEIFHQETTNAIMAGLLIHDVVISESSKNPANREKSDIDNTLELFRTESVHGGIWRTAYKVDSIGEFSAVVYFLGGPTLFPFVTILALTLVLCSVVFLVL